MLQVLPGVSDIFSSHGESIVVIMALMTGLENTRALQMCEWSTMPDLTRMINYRKI